MGRLFNFVRKDTITDIGGNIYHLNEILPVISRLSCFGVIVQQLILKREFNPNIQNLEKSCYESRNNSEAEYDVITDKYQYILNKYNELNPDNETQFLNKTVFKIKDTYSESDKKFFAAHFRKYKVDAKNQRKLEKIAEEEEEKYHEALGPEQELWEEIIFCKFIKVVNKNKYLVEIVPFLLPENSKSGLKAGDRITINPLDINYLNSKDKILEKYIDNSQINLQTIPTELPIVTDWSGCPYKDRDAAVALLREGDQVRIQTNIMNKVTDETSTFCWYVKILKFDADREWFVGLSLDNCKNMDSDYDYENEMKVDCLYYFHKKGILEIPIYEEMENCEYLKKQINHSSKRNITGYVREENDINITPHEILSKFNLVT